MYKRVSGKWARVKRNCQPVSSVVKHLLSVVILTETYGCIWDSSNFTVRSVRKGFVTEQISKNTTENMKAWSITVTIAGKRLLLNKDINVTYTATQENSFLSKCVKLGLVDFNYRPHSGGMGKVMFSQVSVCPQREIPVATGPFSWFFLGVVPGPRSFPGGGTPSPVTCPVQSPMPGAARGRCTPARTGRGVPLPPPPDRRASDCFAAGGMPLAVSRRRTFLFHIKKIKISLQSISVDHNCKVSNMQVVTGASGVNGNMQPNVSNSNCHISLKQL